MKIIPDSTIILLDVPLAMDNKNQLSFNTSEEQFAYFNSLPHVELENATYQRKDNVIRFPRFSR